MQPLDLSVSKAAKEFLHRKFQAWYAQNVCAQLEEKMSKKANRFAIKHCKATRSKMDVRII